MKFLLVGPSGSGKSTIEQKLKDIYGMNVVVSTTDRQKRHHEVEGEHYFFVSTEQFEELRKQDKLSQLTLHQGHGHGIEKRHMSDTCVITVNLDGVKQIIEVYGAENVHVLIVDCPENIRRERQASRGDTDEMINKRLEFERVHFKDIENGVIKGIEAKQSTINANQSIECATVDAWKIICDALGAARKRFEGIE